MLGSGSMTSGDMGADLGKKARAACMYFEEAVRAEVTTRKLVPAIFPALFPCNLLCVADVQTLHVAFSNQNAGGLPVQKWIDKRTAGPFSPSEVLKAAIVEEGFLNASNFDVPLVTWDGRGASHRPPRVDVPENTCSAS